MKHLKLIWFYHPEEEKKRESTLCFDAVNQSIKVKIRIEQCSKPIICHHSFVPILKTG